MQKCPQPAVYRFNGIEERRPDRRLQGGGEEHDWKQRGSSGHQKPEQQKGRSQQARRSRRLRIPITIA
jgi:hypothetical protein